MANLVEPFELAHLSVANRVVMPPMCMYSAQDGLVSDFHVHHYAARAMGGVGTIIVEASGVQPNGRITDRCLGLWDDGQIAGMHRIVEACHAYGAKVLVQLNHAGRKSEVSNDTIVAPSALAYDNTRPVPHALTIEEIECVQDAFVQAARRAYEAGFDGVEIHAAHGYLLNQFLSPLSNTRDDAYGRDVDGRSKLLRDIVRSVRALDAQKAVFVRVSAEEYEPNGLHPQDFAQILAPVKDALDAVHVSSGANTPTVPPRIYPGYQLDFALTIRQELHVPVIGVGLITSLDEAQQALDEGMCDMVAIGRALLRDPSWLVNEQWRRGAHEVGLPQYARAFAMRP